MKKYLISNLIIFLLLFIPAVALAQLTPEAGIDLRSSTEDFGYGAGYDISDSTDDPMLGRYVALIISTFLSILGLIFVILIIIAGYNWMTAEGDETKVTKAKDTIRRAVIGLIIIVAAYAITYFIFRWIPMGSGGYYGGGGGGMSL